MDVPKPSDKKPKTSHDDPNLSQQSLEIELNIKQLAAIKNFISTWPNYINAYQELFGVYDTDEYTSAQFANNQFSSFVNNHLIPQKENDPAYNRAANEFRRKLTEILDENNIDHDNFKKFIARKIPYQSLDPENKCLIKEIIIIDKPATSESVEKFTKLLGSLDLNAADTSPEDNNDY